MIQKATIIIFARQRRLETGLCFHAVFRPLPDFFPSPELGTDSLSFIKDRVANVCTGDNCMSVVAHTFRCF